MVDRIECQYFSLEERLNRLEMDNWNTQLKSLLRCAGCAVFLGGTARKGEMCVFFVSWKKMCLYLESRSDLWMFMIHLLNYLLDERFGRV